MLSNFGLILLVLVVIAAIALAITNQRRFPGRRGSKPGTGDHILHSDYTSGVGGGQAVTWKVPKDPQEYNKLFVPKESDDKK
ncbi:hypothetical protein ROA7450_02385 [Roseovarius albus]|uniref:Uncharacterized protein n=1 Tax=Roseovarius albus TaxID=1247867 RepID=A0A1X6ZDJ4_9RHOB|nr:hypothetical protein [Roseovarius albus]SLN47863.1 hypothetical protein ROA7450_02385 [Roseovarius albus]